MTTKNCYSGKQYRTLVSQVRSYLAWNTKSVKYKERWCFSRYFCFALFSLSRYLIKRHRLKSYTTAPSGQQFSPLPPIQADEGDSYGPLPPATNNKCSLSSANLSSMAANVKNIHCNFQEFTIWFVHITLYPGMCVRIWELDLVNDITFQFHSHRNIFFSIPNHHKSFTCKMICWK